MKDKDIFKEVFSEKLKGHSSDVNPNLWNSIQSQVTGSASGTIAGASGSGTSLGVGTKIAIGIISVATLSTVAILSLNDKKLVNTEEANKNAVVVVDDTKEVKQPENNEIDLEKNINANDSHVKEADFENRNGKETLKQSNKEEDLLNYQEEEDIESVNDKGLLNGERTTTTASSASRSSEEVSTPSNEESNQQKENQEATSDTKEEASFDIVSKLNKGVFTFEIVGDNFDLIEWDFGNGDYNSSRKASYFFEKPGKHKVIARVYKGDESYEVVKNVNIEVEGRILNFPNVFTPDGDGLNDVYFIESENLKDFHITISDENNTVVYESSDVNFVWNGFTMNGNKIKEGNYIVIITATDINGYPINAYQRLSTK